MRDCHQFYIGGAWIDPADGADILFPVIDPATERPIGTIALGGELDVDRAVLSARTALPAWSATTVPERLQTLHKLVAEFKRRYDDIAEAITLEMGAPPPLAKGAQTGIGLSHLGAAIEALEHYAFDTTRGTTRIVREAIGVCGFITPWNWPINQIVCKVAPALACGCTMVLKPSELAPFSAVIWAEICDAAGLPPGVFNLVNGDGPTVGAAIARHPGIDMVSFTGSTRAGIEVARDAAASVKRVHQELGGKSAHIILDDDRLEEGVRWGVRGVALNAGQNCNAPTRMLVPRNRLDEVFRVARDEIAKLSVGGPSADVGPVVSDAHWQRIQSLLKAGIEEGATILAGGVGRPAGLETGYFVRPTVFGDVENNMCIAQEEIFGPVLVIISYDSVDEAVAMANDTPYGLAAYLHGRNTDVLRSLAARLRAGQINLNGSDPDFMAPFGGYKQSGNGREWGHHAFAEFLETKAILGYRAAG
ncbi:aldehyde dehydrogenase family protein [Sphingomonas sp. So64.6b]|uniref:aldehyde dehydrogenase family protein n=1 Tax=Sphingomonas sp. So64.6b TaxID=2997354 RepID=UPI00160138EE|nr:aldehyde dehydrogenase family protein [Sphingomonas sp. So64.6b]QNA87045.1 aldehyde dehydrogenase family protein [Sphingomonas sp. So64.6b]